MSFTINSDKRVYYYKVAVPVALNNSLIYSSEKHWRIGDSVQVSLRGRKIFAVVIQKVKAPDSSFQIRSILSEEPERVRLSPERLKWLLWMAEYYQHSPGLVVHSSFLPSQQHKVSVEKGKAQLKPESSFLLNEEQEKCAQAIQSCSDHRFKVHLIHGVTGSGKTEIYFRLIEPILLRKKSALVLVPEIALTPQHIKRFSLRFPGEVACFHSGMTPAEKTKNWQAVLNKQKNILIGPRSVLFCPIPNLALIIVDEEHESLFKQEDKLKYHGRDSAVYLGKCLNIPVVLASATPSLESWQNVQEGKYSYHCLKKRFFNSPLPNIEIVDLKKEKSLKDTVSLEQPYWLSQRLYTALKLTLEQGGQAALFLNRRGETGYIFCWACGFHFSCVNCDISLTQHQKKHLVCHYCGFRQEKPSQCPECANDELSSFGLGTQTLQKELRKMFPSVCILRADRDEIRNHKEWERVISQMENKEANILIGTQMIAKGLDFPNLSLVGLMLADQGLNRPDFRSAEKSFQLLTQMAGRSGRRASPGQVILQTYNPYHPVIQSVQKSSYEDFVQKELKYRKKYHYPPFGKLVLVRTQSVEASTALRVLEQIRQKIQNYRKIRILGPAPAPLFRLRNKYRYHLLLKSLDFISLQYVAKEVANMKFRGKAVQVHVNVDPVYML